MSIRGSLLNFFLRKTIRKQFQSFDNPEDLRVDGGAPFRIPKDVMTETIDVSGVSAEWVTLPGVSNDHVMLYLHGGGYVFGSPDSHRELAWRFSKGCGVKVLVADYRLAPEHTFPAAVDDATDCYRWLLDQGYSPGKIVVAGDSAGAGLSAALMVNLKNLGLALPQAAVLISPWVDLAVTGESITSNEESDAMLTPDGIRKFARLYLGDRDPKAPLASPLYADLSGLPPVKVIVGSGEILRSDAERLVEEIQRTGGTATLDIWPDMPHVFPMFAALVPEAKKAVFEICEFVIEALGTRAV